MKASNLEKTNPHLLAEYLPWSFLSAPGVVENKDGSLQKSFSFRGPDLDSATKRDLMGICGAFNNAIRRLDAGWSIFIEAQRKPQKAYPEAKWPNRACEIIDKERHKQFSLMHQFFANDYYLTLTFCEPKPLQNKSASWFVKKGADNDFKETSLKPFLDRTAEIEGMLKGVLPKFVALNDDETLSYLHSTVSSKGHHIKTPDIPMYLDHILCDEEVEHGLGLKVGENFVKVLSINAFPTESYPGILDSLNDLNFPFRWSTRFICLGYEGGKKNLENIRRMWFAGRKKLMTILQEVATQSESPLGESGALSKSSDADSALKLLEEGHVSFGQFTATICVWDKDAKLADEKIKKCASLINRLGFSCHIENLNALDAWLGSIPGNSFANIRKPLIHSLNLSHMAPLSAVWAGESSNTHLKAAPHFLATCRGNSPFSFSSNVGDVGHSLIFGPTGSGKSTLLSFMAASWLRYEDAQVFIFDKGYSSRVLTECVGGSFFVVGAKASHACFQPLKNIHQENERIWANEWLLNILADQGCLLNSELKADLWEALTSLAQQSTKSRTLTLLCSLVQNELIRENLSPFTLSGPYGYLFDADFEEESEDFWQAFETGELFDKKLACKAALSYLFHRLEKRFTGRPTLLILDEAWLFLENSAFAQKIKQWLKELRKARVYVIFATQSLSDAMQSPIAMALKESCPSKIFLPNASAQDESSAAFYKAMGLNERQIEIIAKASPKREYYYASSKGNRLFDLALGANALALCASSSVSDQKLLAQLKNPNFKGDILLENFLQHKLNQGVL